MSNVIAFPMHRARANRILVTKPELALRWGVSVRWIEERQRHDGLPMQKDQYSRLVRYDLAEVEAWRQGRLAG
jgi:predicted DNA-binding transcriptional regulator AlpA